MSRTVHEVYDGMGASEVWDLLDDVLDSLLLACGGDRNHSTYTEVRDYVANHVDTTIA